ncbi:MAG: PP2C family serine/threonine-protein phosphatase [Bacteroidota bacterium]
MTKIQIAVKTDAGRIRSLNEDNFVIATDLKGGTWNRLSEEVIDLGDWGAIFMVADGMGGTQAGDVASEIAVNMVQKCFSDLATLPASDLDIANLLKEAIQAAHQAIVNHVTENPEREGMGTTAIIGWLIGSTLYVAWSGDSRAYYFQNLSGLKMISSDHSLVWEQVLKGEITAEQARVHPQSHIITQSLGDIKVAPKPDVIVEAVSAGSKILLCSDGLNGMISDDNIASMLSTADHPSVICESLINAANQNGGEDNTTVILIEVLESDVELSNQPDNIAVTQVVKKDQSKPWWQFW